MKLLVSYVKHVGKHYLATIITCNSWDSHTCSNSISSSVLRLCWNATDAKTWGQISCVIITNENVTSTVRRILIIIQYFESKLHRELTPCWAQNATLPKHDYGQTSLKEEFYNIVSLWEAEIILQLTYKQIDIIGHVSTHSPNTHQKNWKRNITPFCKPFIWASWTRCHDKWEQRITILVINSWNSI